MNGVEFIVLISIIFILSLTLTMHSQSTGESKQITGPGISSCNYYGDFKKKGDKYYLKSIGTMPKECTSIFVEGFNVETNYEVTYTNNFSDDQGLLDKLLKYGKPVYVFYGHMSWEHVFCCDGTDAVYQINHNIEGLKTFMDAHPGIKGLILTELDLVESSSECKGFTDNLVTFIKTMREMFPNLEIGMNIIGKYLLDYCAKWKLEMFDFKVLNNYLDFYVINLYKLNPCKMKFRATGTTPVSGNAHYTMTKVQECLNKFNVPNEKSYYNIQITGTTKDIFYKWYAPYQQICTNPIKRFNCCADTTQSFFEKGKFIKKTAAGFVVAYINFADPKKACHCDREFEPFYDILDGFNGNQAPKSCILMDHRFNCVYKAVEGLGSLIRL